MRVVHRHRLWYQEGILIRNGIGFGRLQFYNFFMPLVRE